MLLDWDVRVELELEAGQGPGAVRAQNNGEEIVEARLLQRSWFFAIDLASKLDLRDGGDGVRIGYEAKGI